MIKKNIFGIVVFVLLIGAFVAGYMMGKGGGPVQIAQAGMPGSQGGVSGGGMMPQEGNVSEHAGQKPQSPAPQAEAAPTTTAETVGQVFYGTAVPYDQANIQSKQGGTITMLNAKEGDTVKKGAVLVRFDDRDKRLELEQMESSKNSALRRIGQPELHGKGAGTKS